MLKRLILFCILFQCFAVLAQNKKKSDVVISTEFGDIKVKLYEQTPLHKENFIKLVKSNFFDGVLFHRVINNFMIQGGDPESKEALPGKVYGEGGPGYEIPAEFVDTLFHKKGAIAAARSSDNVNPQKASSGSQFYIVQGKVYSDKELDAIENQRNNKKKQAIFQIWISQNENKLLKEKIAALQQKKSKDSLVVIFNQIEPTIESLLIKQGKFKFTPKQREVYKTIGGTPFLDGEYTVFGEVVEGIEVVDKIAVTKTDQNDRPLQDVKMNIRIYNK